MPTLHTSDVFYKPSYYIVSLTGMCIQLHTFCPSPINILKPLIGKQVKIICIDFSYARPEQSVLGNIPFKEEFGSIPAGLDLFRQPFSQGNPWQNEKICHLVGRQQLKTVFWSSIKLFFMSISSLV